MAVATQGIALDGDISRQQEVAALCSGAATLSRDGNRIAAMALLWAAVAVDPTDLLAHRRLAAALANAGDLDGAASEYARFIEFMLKQDDVRRAAYELAYARSLLGDMPELRAAAEYSVPLGEIGQAFTAPIPAPRSLPAPQADTIWAPSPSNGQGPTTWAANVPSKSRLAAIDLRGALRHVRQRWWRVARASILQAPEVYLVLSIATAVMVVLVLTMERVR